MASTLVAHLHTSSRLAPVEALKMGRGSESPPELPHSHTGSEQESTSWNLHMWTQTNDYACANKQSQSTAVLGKVRCDSLAQDPSGIRVYPLRQ